MINKILSSEITSHWEQSFVVDKYHIGGVTISVFSTSAVDRGLDPRVGQIKDYEIGIWCFSTKHTSLKKNGKEWLARNQDTVSRVSLFADCCFSELAL
jgi:hypothetical protein